jgi:hypothetical protein
VANPDKLIEEEHESKGTAIADAEIMSICYAALNPGKWGSKVGGHRHDDWVATGRKIRQACRVRNGEIYDVNKSQVQQALAEWVKADEGGRKETLDALVRPLGGDPAGKAFAFPDGTEALKAEWDSLDIADPLAAAQTMQPKESLAEMKKVKGQLSSLYNRVKSAASRWEGVELQHAEMLGHINTRIHEVEARIREVASKIPAEQKRDVGAAPAPAPSAPVGPPTAEEAKHEEAVRKTEEVRGWLDTYNDNIAQMRQYSEAVFAKLYQIEKRLTEFSLTKLSSRIAEVTPDLKAIEDQIKMWDQLYWPTYRLYEQISPYLAIDKSRVEKLHPAGARGRWKQVYDMTRDTSMASR